LRAKTPSELVTDSKKSALLIHQLCLAKPSFGEKCLVWHAILIVHDDTPGGFPTPLIICSQLFLEGLGFLRLMASSNASWHNPATIVEHTAHDHGFLSVAAGLTEHDESGTHRRAMFLSSAIACARSLEQCLS
jgi:hypothetical protein